MENEIVNLTDKVKIVNLRDVKKILVDMDGALSVDMQVPISEEDGTPAYSMRVFTINPGGNTPYHKHPFEHINYVIGGKGILQIDGKDYLMESGDCALVLPNTEHNYRNLSDGEDFVFVCLVPKEHECGCPDDPSEVVEDR